MNPISKQFSSIEQVTGQYLKQKNVTSPSKTSDVSFEDVLRQQQQLKFFKACLAAVESRNISLSEEQNARLEARWNRHMPRELRILWFWWIHLLLLLMCQVKPLLLQWIRRKHNQIFLQI